MQRSSLPDAGNASQTIVINLMLMMFLPKFQKRETAGGGTIRFSPRRAIRVWLLF
jgi:hypothetical protein